MVNFVYFDLGGVVVSDFSGNSKWLELENELGISEKDREAFTLLWKHYERELCLSRDVETMLPILKEKFSVNVSPEKSLLDAFVKRFEKNESLWSVIYEVKEHCKIGLLTNMYPGMLEAIKKNNILPPVSWDIIIDSSIVGFQKPDKEIYEISEEKAGVENSKILFIDNNNSNIQAARNVGWETFLYDSTKPLESTQDLLDFFRSLE